MNTSNINPFYSICSTVLGATSGFLISIPLVLGLAEGGSDPYSLTTALIVAMMTIAGGLMGYKRRESKAFFYISMITTLVLTTTIGFNIQL